MKSDVNIPTSNTPRSKLRGRRVRNVALMIFALITVGSVVVWQNQNLIHSTYTTGYILLGSFLLLTAFNMRKRIPSIAQLGSAAFWMQVHIYVGLATFVLFGLHVGWKIPNGQFELLLTMLYLIVAVSGVYGLYVTRTIPKKLSAINDEVIYESIPNFRVKLAAEARGLVLEACQHSDVLARFYRNRLAEYFERPRSLAYLANPNGRLRRQLTSEINDLDRYLSSDQRSLSQQLSLMVKKKDDLDYHAAQQGRLKIWLFAHIGFTYSLLLLSIFHGVMAHAFAGGLR
jgi:hypothetical protein